MNGQVANLFASFIRFEKRSFNGLIAQRWNMQKDTLFGF